MTKKYDVIIIGAGAAGLAAARAALARGKSVLVLDGGAPLRKVSVSGGGRCNFTNSAADSSRYFGKNPDFAKSALARVRPADILDWAKRHGIKYIEKNPGQFFCKDGAEVLVKAMLADARGADIALGAEVRDVEKKDNEFLIFLQSGIPAYAGTTVVVATGGVSFPSLGASDSGMKIARKFGHKIEPVRPGLAGLKTGAFPAEFAGMALTVRINGINDSLLFTHFGIGGPAAYRASLLDLSKGVRINFMPGIPAKDLLIGAKNTDGAKSPSTVLGAYLPVRFAKWISEDYDKNLADYKDIQLEALAKKINDFVIPNVKVRGFDSAEVMLGGVSTDEISSKTFESKLCPGLYFAGEVLDITGDLGGFNLHWAFASGSIAGECQ
ncbi:MAG: NAD(P)/FAD-dependent oxidoreductase [Rickettsiales bacterium]|jgi:predicted Rossmann fold flavoprotein|nr:NAD(P)/FAD-dependent oxidoreductase [Rickettsiales bacterium]